MPTARAEASAGAGLGVHRCALQSPAWLGLCQILRVSTSPVRILPLTRLANEACLKGFLKGGDLMQMAFPAMLSLSELLFFITLGRLKGLSIQLFLQQSRLFEAEDEAL